MTVAQESGFIEYWSTDHRFGLMVSVIDIDRLIRACTRSYPNETGGIIIGFYNETLDCATITEIVFETPDSKKGRTWFFRGIKGIQDNIHKLWSTERMYYLGEWHFHPGGTSIPSRVDINQMLEIASASNTHCPEPILFLFSGTKSADTVIYRPYVFSKGKMFELLGVL
jgi:integrative and conjugative element protein (TIGR02256 family)